MKYGSGLFWLCFLCFQEKASSQEFLHPSWDASQKSPLSYLSPPEALEKNYGETLEFLDKAIFRASKEKDRLNLLLRKHSVLRSQSLVLSYENSSSLPVKSLQELVDLSDFILKKYPKIVQIPYILQIKAQTLHILGKTPQAMHAYEELVKSFPRSPVVEEAHFALGEQAFRVLDFKKSREHFLKVSPSSPSYPWSLYFRAWCDYNLGLREQSLNLWKQTIVESEKNKNPSLRMSAFLDSTLGFAEKNSDDEAWMFYERNLQKEEEEQDFAQVIHTLANHLKKRGYDHRSIKMLNRLYEKKLPLIWKWNIKKSLLIGFYDIGDHLSGLKVLKEMQDLSSEQDEDFLWEETQKFHKKIFEEKEGQAMPMLRSLYAFFIKSKGPIAKEYVADLLADERLFPEAVKAYRDLVYETKGEKDFDQRCWKKLLEVYSYQMKDEIKNVLSGPSDQKISPSMMDFFQCISDFEKKYPHAQELVSLHALMGDVFLKSHDPSQAKNHYIFVLKKDPRNLGVQAWSNLLLMARGRKDLLDELESLAPKNGKNMLQKLQEEWVIKYGDKFSDPLEQARWYEKQAEKGSQELRFQLYIKAGENYEIAKKWKLALALYERIPYKNLGKFGDKLGEKIFEIYELDGQTSKALETLTWLKQKPLKETTLVKGSLLWALQGSEECLEFWRKMPEGSMKEDLKGQISELLILKNSHTLLGKFLGTHPALPETDQERERLLEEIELLLQKPHDQSLILRLELLKPTGWQKKISKNLFTRWARAYAHVLDLWRENFSLRSLKGGSVSQLQKSLESVTQQLTKMETLGAILLEAGDPTVGFVIYGNLFLAYQHAYNLFTHPPSIPGQTEESIKSALKPISSKIKENLDLYKAKAEEIFKKYKIFHPLWRLIQGLYPLEKSPGWGWIAKPKEGKP